MILKNTTQHSEKLTVSEVYNPQDEITYYYLELNYAEIGHYRRNPCGCGWLYTSYMTGEEKPCKTKKKAIKALENLWNSNLNPERDSDMSTQIMLKCLKLDEYLKTIYKALDHDGQNSEPFVNHYGDLLNEALKVNWEIHTIGEELSFKEFKSLINSK